MTATTTKKTNKLLKWLMIALGAFVALIVLAGIFGSSDDNPTQSADTDPTTTETDLAVQRDDLTTTLDDWFEDCTWENDDSEHTARSSCAENEIGVIVGNSATDVTVVLDAIAETAEGGPGGYAVKDNWAVWSTDQGNVNLASDVLSASSGRESF